MEIKSSKNKSKNIEEKILILSSKDTTQQTSSINDDAYDFVLGLYSLYDTNLKTDTTPISGKISKLNEIKQSIHSRINEIITNKCKHEEIIFYETLEQIEKNYLLDILDNLLKIKSNALIKEEITNHNALSYILREIGYFDSKTFLQQFKIPQKYKTIDGLLKNIEGQQLIKALFQEEEEFSFSYLKQGITQEELREDLIRDLFKNNYSDYFNTFRTKSLIAAKTLFKQLLFFKLSMLDNNKIKEALLHLTSKHYDLSYNQDIYKLDKLLFTLFNTNYSLKMIKDGQRGLCEILKILSTLKLNNKTMGLLNVTADEKHILAIITYLKSNPSKKLKDLKKRVILNELKDLYASDKPNTLTLYLENIDLQISHKHKSITQNEPKILQEEDISRIHDSLKLDFIHKLCDEITHTVIAVYSNLISKESQLVQDLQWKYNKEKAIKLFKPIGKILFVAMVALVLKGSSYYFFDIESIYKNRFYKESNNLMEAIPYPAQIIDSLNPTQNEMMQKKRLDYIKDINTSYFKPLALFLSPELNNEQIKDVIQDLSLPSQLSSIESITNARYHLATLIKKERWLSDIEPIIGPNIFTQLRAYGAATNFLIPPLTHFVMRNEQGLPIKINGKLTIHQPTSEKEILKQDFISMYHINPAVYELEPRNYIKNHDTSYKEITRTTSFLLKQVRKKKGQVIQSYRHTQDISTKAKLKDTLIAIAVLEGRLSSLEEKIKNRYNYIVKNNSYRMPIK